MYYWQFNLPTRNKISYISSIISIYSIPELITMV